MDSPQSGRTMQLQFNGKAGEYFKIWIVNLALSIITLGIYSPWAKVRSKRYFYGNTTLAGSSFDYLADPLAILKGRMIVFAFILVYAVTTQYIPLLEFAFIIIYMIALPWMVIKSMQFNTRNSAYRNIRFNFDGKLGEAAFIFIGLTFFSIITLGFAIPYMVKRFKQFTVEHSYFGTTKFGFHASGGSFYMIYLKIFIIPIIIAVIGIIAAIAIPSYNAYINASKAQLNPQQQVEMQQDTAQQTSNSQATEQPDQYQHAENDETTEPDISCTQTPPPPGQCPTADKVETNPLGVTAMIAGVVFYILFLAFYLLMGVYIQARTANLVLNNTTLKSHKLNSTLRVRDMFAIYLTNIFAVVFSLGLLIPWATIRLARYRFAHTAFIANGDISDFIADEQRTVSAAGGEFTEAFDIDLGF